MRGPLFVAMTASALVGCSLLVSLSGLDDGTSNDSGAPDSTSAQDSGDAAQRIDGSDGGSSYLSEVIADSPIAYYRLDDTSAKMADFTAHHLDGQYGSAVTKSVKGLLGPSDVDTATMFNGIDAGGKVIGANVPESSLFEVTNAISIEMWIRITTLPSGAGSEAVSYGAQSQSPYQPWDIQYGTNGTADVVMQFYAANVGYLLGQTALSADTTYYVVATFDGSNLRLYLNSQVEGVLAADSSTFTDYDGGLGLGIGSGPIGDAPCGAVIDEVAIYDHALAPDRVIAHYLAGTN